MQETKTCNNWVKYVRSSEYEQQDAKRGFEIQ